MDQKIIKEAEREAVRFLKALRDWYDRMEADRRDGLVFLATREGGALRRASMDLTRALAEMRKS